MVFVSDVSDVLDHLGQIYSPLNLANMYIQKLEFVRNNAPDNQSQRVLNFMGNPKLALILVYSGLYQTCQPRYYYWGFDCSN